MKTYLGHCLLQVIWPTWLTEYIRGPLSLQQLLIDLLQSAEIYVKVTDVLDLKRKDSKKFYDKSGKCVTYMNLLLCCVCVLKYTVTLNLPLLL